MTAGPQDTGWGGTPTLLSRSEPVLIAVRAGQFRFRWRGRVGRALAGDLLMLAQGEPVLAWYDEQRPPWLQTFEVPAAVIKRFEAAHGELLIKLAPTPDADRLQVVMSEDAKQVWALIEDCRQRLRPATIHEHLLHYLLLTLALEGVAPGFLASQRGSIVRRVQWAISEHPELDWRLSRVARELGMSEMGVRRALARAGTSFRLVLEDVRMSRALELVAGSDLPVQEVAAFCGYECPSRFTARFKSRYGVTPRQLREGAGGL